MALLARLRSGGGKTLASGDQLPVELGDLLAAGVDRRQLGPHLLPQRGERVGLDAVLAGEPANVEQPRFDLVEPPRVERQGVGRAHDPVLGLAGLDQGAVERRQRLAEQGMVGGAALDPPGRLAEQRQRALRPAEQLVQPGQRFPRFQPGLHRRPLFGEAGFLAFFGRQRVDLGAGMLEIVAVALGRRRLGASVGQLMLDANDLGPGGFDDFDVEPAEGIEQRPMSLGIEQAAIIVLAVDLHRQSAKVTKHAGRHRGWRRRRRGCRRRSSRSGER